MMMLLLPMIIQAGFFFLQIRCKFNPFKSKLPLFKLLIPKQFSFLLIIALVSFKPRPLGIMSIAYLFTFFPLFSLCFSFIATHLVILIFIPKIWSIFFYLIFFCSIKRSQSNVVVEIGLTVMRTNISQGNSKWRLK